MISSSITAFPVTFTRNGSLKIILCVKYVSTSTEFSSTSYLAAARHEVLQQLHALADLLPPHLEREPVNGGNHLQLMFFFLKE
jgi:hypothetical protein